MDEININPLANISTETVTPMTPPKEVVDMQINGVANDVKSRYSQDFMDLKFQSENVNPFAATVDIRPGFREYNVNLKDAYVQLNSGDFTPRFESFLPGVNNEERLAATQTTGEKWLNGLTKFGGKTLTAIVGGTIGVVDGAIKGISEGSLSAAYNTDLNGWLDDLNTKMDHNLPNYYTEQEKNQGFGSSLGTANFWANDVLGGLSFTAGAIVSEGIWAYATGGTSLLAGAGRWSTNLLGKTKALRALNVWKAEAKLPIVNSFRTLDDVATEGLVGISELSKTTAIQSAKTKNFLNTSRFLLTSAGYESAVEARHYMKETQENWLREFEVANGRRPDAQESANFDNDLRNSANAVFATNLGLVGASNLATIGKITLGKSLRPEVSNNWFNKNVLGVGFNKTPTGVFETVSPTRLQKITGKVYGVGKYGVTEGIFEEGGQSVASATAQNYILAGYNPENLKETYGIMESFYDAMSQTYGTKEGFKEVGIGFIIGILGGGANTGFRFNEVSQERQSLQRSVDTRNAFTSDMVIERMKTSSKIIDAQKRNDAAQEQNDLTGEIMTDKEAMVASISRDYKFQGVEDGKKDFAVAVANTNTPELAQDLGITEQEAIEWKDIKIQEYNDLADRHAKNLDYSEALLGQTRIAGVSPQIRADLQDAFAFTFTMGENAENVAQNISLKIKQLVAQDLIGSSSIVSAIEVDDVLDRVSQEKQTSYNEARKRKEAAQQKITQLERGLIKAQYTRAEATETSNRAAELTQQLAQATDDFQRYEAEQQAALDAFNIETISPGTTLTVEMLDSQLTNVQKLKSTLEDIRVIDPQRYAIIQKLISEQNKAVRYAKSYNDTARTILDPATRITTINGWVSNLMNGRKELETSLNDFFIKSVQNYKENVISIEAVETQAARTELNYQRFKKGEPLSPQYIQELQDMAKNNQAMNPQQKEMYEANQEVAEENDVDIMKPPTQEVEETGSMVEKLRQKINNIIKGNDYLVQYYGEDIEELRKKSPSQEEIERYNELIKKINPQLKPEIQKLVASDRTLDIEDAGTGLTQQELTELQNLAINLNQWKILDGSSLQAQDSSITDLLNILDKLESQQTAGETKTELDTKDCVRLGTAEERVQSTDANSTTTIITPDKVLVKKTDNNYLFSFLNVTSFPRLFPNSQLFYVDKNGVEKAVLGMSQKDIENNIKREGAKFKLKIGEEGLDLTIGVHSQIVVNSAQFDNLSFNSNVKIVNFGSESYIPIYEKMSNGTFIPLESDFTFNSIESSENIPLNVTLINSLPNGTTLYSSVNLNDTYNQKLIEDFKKQEERFNKGKITEEQFNQILNDVENKLNIYIMYDNELVGSLRALTDKSAISLSAERNKALRQKAIELVRANPDKINIDLGQTLKLRISLIGSPNLSVQENEQGQLQPANQNFTEQALENVVGTGYMQDGNTQTEFKGGLDNMFINPISKRNAGQKVPFIIYKQGSRNIVYPIALIKTLTDRSSELDFLNSPLLSKDQKANLLLDTLIQSGLNPQNYKIDFSTEWVENSDTEIQSIIDDLSQVETFINVDILAGDYNKNNLILDAQISIDLANTPFAANKIVVNIEEVKPFDGLQNLEEQFENAEQERIRLESELSNELIALNTEILTNPEFQDINNSFTEVFDDANVFTQPTSNTQIISNVNILREAFSKPISKKLMGVLGEQNVKDIRNLLNTLDNLRGKQKNIKVEIKNQQLKKSTENVCSQ